MKFRKRPVVIDAMEFTASNSAALLEWLDSFEPEFRGKMYDDGSGLEIDTLEGTMMAYPGDWIIRGIKGEFYPIKPDIFLETYEAVTE